MTAKFIARLDTRVDVPGQPIQFYAMEVSTEEVPVTRPREIEMNLHSSMYPLTIAELAMIYLGFGRKLMELAQRGDNPEPTPVPTVDYGGSA